MKSTRHAILIAMLMTGFVACGDDDPASGDLNSAESNNGTVNNGSTNNDSTNNSSTNNDSTNNSSTNNNSTNNGSTNNGSTNNGSTNNGSTNNVDEPDMGTDMAEPTVCEAGFQDNDDDGDCEPGCKLDPEAMDCGEHGTCANPTGPALCVCDAGYEGDACENCAPGYEMGNQGECVLNLPPTQQLSLWLDADEASSLQLDGQQHVSSWTDRRPAGATVLAQTVVSARPAYVENLQNGRAGVRFDGGDQLFVSGYFGLATDDYEVIVALDADSRSGPSAILGATNGVSTTDWAVMLDQHQATDFLFTHRSTPGMSGGTEVVADRTTPLNAGWVAASLQTSGTINTASIWASDGAQDVMTVAGAANDSGIGASMTLRLGRSQGGFMNGKIFEVLIYTRRLTVSEREEVVDYLEAKWGM